MKHLYPENISDPRLEKFKTTICDRCGRTMYRSTVSFFVLLEYICQVYGEQEIMVKDKLVEKGKNPAVYEGIGFMPEVL